MLTIGVAVLAVAWARSDGGRFTAMSVERIDVVDANGTRRMAITNRERLPNVVIEGKELARARRAVHRPAS